MRTRAIIALGIGQCVNWGVLYYAFAILLLPLEAALGLPRWAVAGAFSLALLVSAVAAPVVGRWSDQGRAPAVMRAGGIGAVVLLLAWALFPGRAMLYVAWAGLGLCMASTLYEPAFAIVGRAHAVPAEYKSRREEYVDLVVEQMLPQVAAEGLADYCDVFAEPGVFDRAQSERVLAVPPSGVVVAW